MIKKAPKAAKPTFMLENISINLNTNPTTETNSTAMALAAAVGKNAEAILAIAQMLKPVDRATGLIINEKD
jgi:hypothetical protein